MKTRFWQQLCTVVQCKGACGLSTVSMEKRPGVGFANISYTEKGEENWKGKWIF